MDSHGLLSLIRVCGAKSVAAECRKPSCKGIVALCEVLCVL